MNSMTCDCDIFKTNTAEMKSFSTKCISVPSSNLLLSPAKLLCWRGLFIHATAVSCSCARRAERRREALFSNPIACPFSVLKENRRISLWTSQVCLLSQRLLLDMKGLFVTHHDYFSSPFLIQSNVLIVTLLTMGVFPDSGLALTLCSSVISSSLLRRWVASGPFVSINTASDLHTNQGARKNSCVESFL